jgi:uncharacterized pyridoxal phosphate-containing UPF0001 family protein
MIKDNLHEINSKLPSDVTLVAVSKFHPVERLMEAYNAGQRVFAESRPQELAAKVPQMPADVRWHFIGHLQTNKLKLVLPYVSLVQSVDSLHLLQAISTWAVTNSRVIDVLLELHLGEEETKQGFSEDEIMAIISGAGISSQTHGHPRPCKREGPTAASSDALRVGRGRSEAEAVCGDIPAPLKGVRIRGLMGMASNTEDRAQVEGEFARIEALYKRIKASGMEGFDILSIGMSGDWPLAVQHGATMVRIGTDIFGPREY